MIILIGLIILLVIIAFEYKIQHQEGYEDWELTRIFTIPLLVVWFITLLILIFEIISFRTIDDKIKLYEEQNKEIEEKIELVVKNYMGYESDIFKDLKSDSYITLVTTYPDLKSDKLVQQQINLYYKNNKKIVELKEQKINKTIYKWWLFFGK